MQVGTHTPLIGATDAATAQQASQQGGQDASFEAAMSETSQTDTHADMLLSDGAEGSVPLQPLIATPTVTPIKHSTFARAAEADPAVEQMDATGREKVELNEGGTTKASVSLTLQNETAKQLELGRTTLVTPKEGIQSPPQPSSDTQNNKLSDGTGREGKTPPSVNGHEQGTLLTGGNAQPDIAQKTVSPTKPQALTGADISPLTTTQMRAAVASDKAVVMPPPVREGASAGTSKQAADATGTANLDDLISKASIKKGSTAKPAVTPAPEMAPNLPSNTVGTPQLLAKAFGQGDVTGRPDKATRQEAPTSEASPPPQLSDVTSHKSDGSARAYFSNELGASATSKLALLQDTGLQNPGVLSPLDPIVSEQVFDLAIADARAAETPSGRAEVSAHIRTELPRHVAMQLADVAKTMPDRPVELTLSPKELGRLRLTFTGDLSAMTVSVNVERPETLDLMRRHIDMLAQEMRDIGYGEVTFSFEQSGAEAGEQSSDAETSGGHENPNSNSMGTSPDINPAPVRLSVMGASGVDIRL